MALPNARQFDHEGRSFEWVVRRRGNALRVVVQDAQARGQLLVINTRYFDLVMSGEKGGDFYARIAFGPGFLRDRITLALNQGWQPKAKGLPLFSVADHLELDEFPQPWGMTGFTLERIENLWSVLNAITRDPAWRARLASTYGEVVGVPPEYIIGIDPELWDRLEHSGGLQVFRTAWDPKGGDNAPCLAIRTSACPIEVLEDVLHWYRTPE